MAKYCPSKDELLQILRDYYNKNNKIPRQKDFTAKNGLPSYSVYVTRFGSFKNAILEANLDISNEKGRYGIIRSDEDLLNILKIETEKHLLNNLFLLTQEEIDAHNVIPHGSIYQRRFGGIKNAYKLIGYDYDNFNKIALEKDMINKYINLCNELGYTLNSRDIDKYSKLGKCYATKTYTEHFGSIYKLQIMCGFIPTKMGINRTKEEMIDDLIKLGEELGDIPTADDIDVCDYTCCTSYYIKQFGSITTVLKLAGFKNVNKKVYITNKGTKCFSSYEYRFAKMLEDNNIDYIKDEYYKDYILNFNKKYKFDFTVIYNDYKYFIEIFGIEDNEFYKVKTNEKISLCKDNHLPLIQFYPSDFKNIKIKSLYKLLINKLNNINISHKEVS